MSSIEERLVRDIATVTGGIIVTDSDLREARRAVDERIEGRQRRDRVRTVVGVAAGAAVLAGLGFTAVIATGGQDDDTAQLANRSPTVADPHSSYLTGEAPTRELLEGIWRVDNGESVLQFYDNGTMRIDDRGTLFSDPGATGTYAIDGDVLTLATTGGARGACVGTTRTVRASFPEPGIMRFVRSDTASTCSYLTFGPGALEKLLPTSDTMAGVILSRDRGWQPVSDRATLLGVWIAEGGGHLLEMTSDGSYFIADDSGEPIDRGQWALRDSALTLTSSARSVECSQGDRLILAGLEWVDMGTTGIRGTLRGNACGGSWTPAAWILIPHVGSDRE